MLRLERTSSDRQDLITGADGIITVDGILPGYLSLRADRSEISTHIDNCRSDTASNRDLNFDLAYVKPQYYGDNDY